MNKKKKLEIDYIGSDVVKRVCTLNIEKTADLYTDRWFKNSKNKKNRFNTKTKELRRNCVC